MGMISNVTVLFFRPLRRVLLAIDLTPESEPEIFQAMDDLREVGVQVLTMGQYLRPSPQHLPVVEYVHPDTFQLYGEIARRKGFEHVASGPLVRSSYHAADFVSGR